jgi:hypothetical protein
VDARRLLTLGIGGGGAVRTVGLRLNTAALLSAWVPTHDGIGASLALRLLIGR